MNYIYHIIKNNLVGLLTLVLLLPSLGLFSQQINDSQKKIVCQVIDSETGMGLPGASILSSTSNQETVSGADGYFDLVIDSDTVAFTVRHIGYVSVTWNSKLITDEPIVIKLDPLPQEIELVEISTGYQMLPKERLTGSFGFIGEKEVAETASRNILQRLEGQVSGVLMNNPGSNQMNIRGRNTILSNDQPLIVVDQFAYEGDINLINPNDVQSITVLKDAAASSIWGARASNGVIVITTKKGSFSEKNKVSFSTSLGFRDKPDLFNISVISGEDYIEFEKFLFEQGFYKSQENNSTHPNLTPAIELLIGKRDGTMDASFVDQRIEELKQYDVRYDFEKYMYRPATTQQYGVNLRGGTGVASWFFSGGYDQEQNNTFGSKTERISIRNNLSLKLTNKLIFENTLVLSQDGSNNLRALNAYPNFSLGGMKTIYPYARLVDDNGNPLALPKDLRDSFKEAAFDQGLLDWSFVPLHDLEAASHYRVRTTDYLIRPSLTYTILPGLRLSNYYQFERMVGHTEGFSGVDTYEARSMINRYTQVDENGNLIYAVPLGGIMDNTNTEMFSHQFRSQIDYSWQQLDNHFLNIIAGFEIRNNKTSLNASRIYGFQERGLASFPVDYKTRFKYYDSPLSGVIPSGNRMSEYVKRFLSYYTNVGYSYQNKYDLSASARIDKSNMFGVKINQRMVPLWSLGGAWHISKEEFYHMDFMPDLKLRATYGYNGNVSDASGVATIRYENSMLYPILSARLMNPPNESLQWEKTKSFNVGIDFSMRPIRLHGSIEYFHKKNMNLLSRAAIDPTTGLGDLNGYSTYTGNVATIVGSGVDITLGAEIVQSNWVSWNSSLLFSVANHKVTEYFVESTIARDYINSNSSVSPQIGYPVYAVFSYPWGGLDPENGAPLGVLNGETTKEYNKITGGPVEDLVYHGPARAPLFGSFRNRIKVKGVELDVQLAYRFGYYYRRSSISYGYMSQTWSGHGDYALRWQKPGDEQITNVPALNYPLNTTADSYYGQSEVLIERGDHIRIRGIALRYQWQRTSLSLHASNLGFIWLANSKNADPFAENRLRDRPTFSFTINMDF